MTPLRFKQDDTTQIFLNGHAAFLNLLQAGNQQRSTVVCTCSYHTNTFYCNSETFCATYFPTFKSHRKLLFTVSRGREKET